jgi:hypothetical protein
MPFDSNLPSVVNSVNSMMNLDLLIEAVGSIENPIIFSIPGVFLDDGMTNCSASKVFQKDAAFEAMVIHSGQPPAALALQ